MTEVINIADWVSASKELDALKDSLKTLDLHAANEAQTRFDVIDRFIRNVLGWKHGQVRVEEAAPHGKKRGYVDYILSSGDYRVVIEAKKIGATFPSPSKTTRLKLNASILSDGEMGSAIKQAEQYAEDKNADITCVTNGYCWCFYSRRNQTDETKAILLFPLDTEGNAAKLYDYLSEPSIRKGSIGQLLKQDNIEENRLLNIVRDADGRLNRNNIAEYIIPALNKALSSSADADREALSKWYVATEGRVKFDSQLGVHLSDNKLGVVDNALRIRRGRANSQLERLISAEVREVAPPVTLIIGSVGSGKSTYLEHFKVIGGSEILKKAGAHWIYIDFEVMGKEGTPRTFIYGRLLNYLLGLTAADNAFETIIRPAYAELINGLTKGAFKLIAADEAELNRRITDLIENDYKKVEPYVDRVLGYIAKQKMCVIVLDNVDLFEDSDLETIVFSEGIGISKRLNTNVIVSIRDETYIEHKNSATFNAFELNRLWLDPPPFRDVLSRRLTYSKVILSGKAVDLAFGSSMHLHVPDIGVFFDIVQRSVLQGSAGQYIEDMADLNIRRGLTLINNFLTSGHIQADRALKAYVEGQTEYYFPFHEVFKGTILREWKYFKENRADQCVNLFDARLFSSKLQLLRIYILQFLTKKAKSDTTKEVPVKECLTLFSCLGASKDDIFHELSFLRDYGLVRSEAKVINEANSVTITRTGAYYIKQLCKTFVYAEQCLFDTAIYDDKDWATLSDYTLRIDLENYISPVKMKLRRSRIAVFTGYLEKIDTAARKDAPELANVDGVQKIVKAITSDANFAFAQASKWYEK